MLENCAHDLATARKHVLGVVPWKGLLASARVERQGRLILKVRLAPRLRKKHPPHDTSSGQMKEANACETCRMACSLIAQVATKGQACETQGQDQGDRQGDPLGSELLRLHSLEFLWSVHASR